MRQNLNKCLHVKTRGFKKTKDKRRSETKTALATKNAKIVENKRFKKHVTIKLGACNVRGKFDEGKLKDLTNEISKLEFDIVAQQEIKQKRKL